MPKQLDPASLGCSEELLQAEMDRLAQLIDALTPNDGTFGQSIPGVYLNRYTKTESNWVKAFQLPSLLIVAQGSKAITVGHESFQVENKQLLTLPVALPISLRTTQASPDAPFLSVGLYLDPERIADLAPKIYPNGLPPVHMRSPGYIAGIDLKTINAVIRLLECLNNPEDAELLTPLIKDEIMIRVLRSPIGVHIAETACTDSEVQQISRAIQWLCDNFSQPIKVADLAELTHMSVSVFYEHFKAVTSMSPLQYQKALRLQEARRLMLSQQMDATTACQLVGYVSDSQFSRDYSSYFGNPPKRDIAKFLK